MEFTLVLSSVLFLAVVAIDTIQYRRNRSHKSPEATIPKMGEDPQNRPPNLQDA
jgi:hypothetical protein